MPLWASSLCPDAPHGLVGFRRPLPHSAHPSRSAPLNRARVKPLASEIAGDMHVRIDGALIDAAIADCALPDGDAFPLCPHAETRGIPVILAAKHASIDLAACAIEHGMADLIEASGPINS